jgi:hypothetical protein
MALTIKPKEPEEIEGPEDQPRVSEIKEMLRLILESHPFRTSKQCQNLLRYIVHHSLSSDDTALREKIIGVEVFGREPAYDTNDDPVVRVRAADVRKRLAQYYQSLGPGSDVLHIELEPGSYRVHFRRDPQSPEGQTGVESPVAQLQPKEESSSRFSFRRARIAALLLIAGAIAGAALWIQPIWMSPEERFWAPLTTGKQPVLIYLGTNVAYVFTPEFLSKYRAAHGLPYNGPEFFVDLPKGSTVKAEDLLPVKDTFLATSAVDSTVQVTTQLRDWRKPFLVRSGRDISFGDLRNRPSILVGAFNNPWTLELTNDLPYHFSEGVRIESKVHPDQSWTIPADSRNSSTDDYALITRLLSSKTGGPILTVAGIGEYGTQASAEFLTNPDKMRDLLKTAPRGWENKNMQAVLHVKVVGFLPVAVDVVATTYW